MNTLGEALRMVAVAIAVGAAAATAAPGSGQFQVTAAVAGAPESGYCTKTAGNANFGAVVTILCAGGGAVGVETPPDTASWIPIHGGAYRFGRVAGNARSESLLLDGVSEYTGLGTVTSWRMVSLENFEYLEMQIGW
ncbi:MAG: hypothetical protein M0Z99_15470 [Betaproteobacteria bacterium]|nr:hypothetical protein [Betaproteobacteria bacterium]